jgi:hypothetical protein
MFNNESAVDRALNALVDILGRVAVLFQAFHLATTGGRVTPAWPARDWRSLRRRPRQLEKEFPISG